MHFLHHIFILATKLKKKKRDSVISQAIDQTIFNPQHYWNGLGDRERVLYNTLCQRQVKHWGEDRYTAGNKNFVSLLKSPLPY